MKPAPSEAEAAPSEAEEAPSEAEAAPSEAEEAEEAALVEAAPIEKETEAAPMVEDAGAAPIEEEAEAAPMVEDAALLEAKEKKQRTLGQVLDILAYYKADHTILDKQHLYDYCQWRLKCLRPAWYTTMAPERQNHFTAERATQKQLLTMATALHAAVKPESDLLDDLFPDKKSPRRPSKDRDVQDILTSEPESVWDKLLTNERLRDYLASRYEGSGLSVKQSCTKAAYLELAKKVSTLSSNADLPSAETVLCKARGAKTPSPTASGTGSGKSAEEIHQLLLAAANNAAPPSKVLMREIREDALHHFKVTIKGRSKEDAWAAWKTALNTSN